MNNDSTQAVLEPRTRHLLDQRLEPRILGVGTALPAHRIAQPDVRTLVRALFAGQYRDIDRLVNIFENSQIRTRHLCEPLEWFQQERPFAEKNALYAKHALELGERAARAALENAGLGPRDVDAIVFVSTTGIATPSLDSLLIKRLDLSRHVTRTPVWGLGCAGGAAGLARALEGGRARPIKLGMFLRLWTASRFLALPAGTRRTLAIKDPLRPKRGWRRPADRAFSPRPAISTGPVRPRLFRCRTGIGVKALDIQHLYCKWACGERP